MKLCKGCGEQIPNRITLDDGHKINTSKRKYCLNCSPFGEHRMNPRTLDLPTRFCPGCKKTLPIKSFAVRYKDTSPRASSYCKRCVRTESIKRQRRFKQRCVEYKGGACIKCGYSKCLGALEFHHRDPTTKSFGINRNTSHAWTEKLMKELDKCDLVCANCHREIQFEEEFSARGRTD